MTSLALELPGPIWQRDLAPGEFGLEVTGRPASKKNSMMIVRYGRGPNAKHGLIQSERYREWEKRALLELAEQWGGRPPITVPVTATFYVRCEPIQRMDMYNAIAAMSDALQKAGVLKNDKLITRDGGSTLIVVRNCQPGIRAILLPSQVAL